MMADYFVESVVISKIGYTAARWFAISAKRSTGFSISASDRARPPITRPALRVGAFFVLAVPYSLPLYWPLSSNPFPSDSVQECPTLIMAIDDCPHSFAELANKVLPAHMASLRTAMDNQSPMSLFAESGVGPATLANRFKLPGDFAGCYVLLGTPKPIYVGISRRVFHRLRQHVLGTTHYAASLAYRIASSRQSHALTRDDAMCDPAFQTAFADAQHYIRGLSVAFIPIPNPLELYLFEAYAAMELDTHEWNTFETH